MRKYRLCNDFNIIIWIIISQKTFKRLKENQSVRSITDNLREYTQIMESLK